MTITLGRWGVGLVIGGFVMELFVGDVYAKMPGVGEVAWNREGLFMDRGSRETVDAPVGTETA